MATATRTRSVAPVSSGRSLSLEDVTGKSRGLPSRMVVHATEGWGKTSFAAQAPKPIFLMARGETGLETLIDQGRLPEIPHFPEINSWSEWMGALETLKTGDHDFKTLVADAINGTERLCHEKVCRDEFKGEWGDRGFASYQKGYEVSLTPWREMLSALDALRETKHMAIILICHTHVRPFRDPEGEDYDRYTTDLHHKTWGLTHKWADLVLFGNFEVFRDDKGKPQGGAKRIIHTERRAAYDAKNRHGLDEEIYCGNSPQEAWANFQAAIKKGRGK